MHSKPNRERLDPSPLTNMLYTQAAFNIPSGYLPSSHEFLKEDDDADERRRKNFEMFQNEISFRFELFFSIVKFRFELFFYAVKFRLFSFLINPLL